MNNMTNRDADALLKQIKNIILNRPISKDLKCESEELADLQEAIFYLADCLSESNEFLREMSEGNLDAKMPGRGNFLAASLKELHSWLKHLTWQANQVASGDYNQKVGFLGDFSLYFNEMTTQLSEREEKLKMQSSILNETNSLMKSVMDGLKDWIIVTEKETGDIIYTNRAAQQLLFNTDTQSHICGKNCELLQLLQRDRNYEYLNTTFDYYCSIGNRVLRTRTYEIQWNENLSFVHYIIDITNEKEEQEHIQELAYRDELTNLYNRRYCVEQLDDLLVRNIDFSFCMVDLDGLKYANDKLGHIAGDEYLKIVAKEMLALTRAADVVCRFGGDEFAIIFPYCTAQIALEKLHSLNENLSKYEMGYPMSVSYGVVHIESGSDLTSEDLMIDADEKMYIRKRAKKSEYYGSFLDA